MSLAEPRFMARANACRFRRGVIELWLLAGIAALLLVAWGVS